MSFSSVPRHVNGRMGSTIHVHIECQSLHHTSVTWSTRKVDFVSLKAVPRHVNGGMGSMIHVHIESQSLHTSDTWSTQRLICVLKIWAKTRER